MSSIKFEQKKCNFAINTFDLDKAIAETEGLCRIIHVSDIRRGAWGIGNPPPVDPEKPLVVIDASMLRKLMEGGSLLENGARRTASDPRPGIMYTPNKNSFTREHMSILIEFATTWVELHDLIDEKLNDPDFYDGIYRNAEGNRKLHDEICDYLGKLFEMKHKHVFLKDTNPFDAYTEAKFYNYVEVLANIKCVLMNLDTYYFETEDPDDIPPDWVAPKPEAWRKDWDAEIVGYTDPLSLICCA